MVFESSEGEYSFVVHLDKKHCDRRLWMLRDIPSPHAICAYYYLNQDPDQHVEHWYKKKTFLKAYNHFIRPIPNMRMWPETTNPSIEPPKLRKISASFAAATRGNKRPTTGFGVYSDHTTGAQVFNNTGQVTKERHVTKETDQFIFKLPI
ncbi:hypothetical protein MTR67_034071 [Solanum verrucosum]|uniref:Uncharacterized protein n=1 Tax=Solanum verrucosum TaxID=315347 RepID=A0AAF0U7N1_SOLVR|nr:hypothetical protein MTR67_034071 [Solanum verrucosum]